MTTVPVILAALPALLVLGGEQDDEQPSPITSAVSIRLIERGAILVEDFDSRDLDLTRWRVWQNHPDRTTVRPDGGRLRITARGRIAMEGLWGLTTAKYKDVVLVGEMDIRSTGAAPHRLALHLCGGDGLRSPDHWVEILMSDLGDKARFFPSTALPAGLDRRPDQYIELPHPPGQGFLCRLTLSGDTNLTELEVKAPDGWRRICDPIELPLRTVHTEVKLHSQLGSARGDKETTSQAWFDNVRIYPRPPSHHIGIRLVRPDGNHIWVRQNGGWPPKITDPQGRLRSIEDIEVQLRTEDGTVVSSVRSAHMGFYLLPLKDAPWDVYPVAAEVRVLLDGTSLGEPLKIECHGLNGLYPDDVYDAVLR
ncbi:MAG: hypothetical protein MUF48_25050 [Pirellulaceae bacterium]|jgi:hypothetical protein|nr:hypothetical protein [Pirellulaceae bacterium]